jgi:hypothetical protein
MTSPPTVSPTTPARLVLKAKYNKPLLAKFLSEDDLVTSSYVSGYIALLQRLVSPTPGPRQLSLLPVDPDQTCLDILHSLSNTQLEATLPAPYLAHFLNPCPGTVLVIPFNRSQRAVKDAQTRTMIKGLIVDNLSAHLATLLTSRVRIITTGKHTNTQIALDSTHPAETLPFIVSDHYQRIYCKVDDATYEHIAHLARRSDRRDVIVQTEHGAYLFPTSDRPYYYHLSDQLYRVPPSSQPGTLPPTEMRTAS